MSTTDDPLVSTDWLAAHIDDPKVKVIDASFKLPGVLPLPVDDYLAAHIPGAVFFDVDAISDHDNPRPHMFPDAAQFARDIAGLGISTGDTVVAYDSGGWVAAPRAWWMFLSFGYANVKVLDGGLQKWTREGRPTHSGSGTPKPGRFKAKLDPTFVRSQQHLVENLQTGREQVVDARPRPRFALFEPVYLVVDTVDHAHHRRLRVAEPLIVVERPDRFGEEAQQQLRRNRADFTVEFVDEVALDLGHDRGALLLLELDGLHRRLTCTRACRSGSSARCNCCRRRSTWRRAACP